MPRGYAYGYKKRMKKKEQYFLDVQSSRQKARKNARQPGIAELRRKAILSVLDATFGCYQLDSRKQRLLVETLHAYVR